MYAVDVCIYGHGKTAAIVKRGVISTFGGYSSMSGKHHFDPEVDMG